MSAIRSRRFVLAATGAAVAGLMSMGNTSAASVSDTDAASSDALESAAHDTAAEVSTGFNYSGELTQGGWIRGVAPGGAIEVTLGEAKIDLADDGSFFAAFDRDSAEELVLSATIDTGRRIGETLSVSPRDWQIERVNVAKRGGGTSEAWWKKREPEWNAIVAARAKETGAAGWRQDFIWPVTGRISGRFGRQRIYRGEPGSYHSGIDIAPGNGVPFVAPADGVVVLARTGFSLEGGLIIIDHGAGLNSAFLHASKIAVAEGDSVRQGQHIGNVGATGRATGPHLHWSLKWNDARLDPLLFTGPMN
ncbi:M23 family metallopeptidase [Erythrobacter rubeus]|nr:M23 family metallopeptidase [Erythrobacter rubeus]